MKCSRASRAEFYCWFLLRSLVAFVAENLPEVGQKHHRAGLQLALIPWDRTREPSWSRAIMRWISKDHFFFLPADRNIFTFLCATTSGFRPLVDRCAYPSLYSFRSHIREILRSRNALFKSPSNNSRYIYRLRIRLKSKWRDCAKKSGIVSFVLRRGLYGVGDRHHLAVSLCISIFTNAPKTSLRPSGREKVVS